MELGFLTNRLVEYGMNDLNEIAAWAKENGFTALEVGPTIPLDESLYKNVMESGMKISGLTYCRNFLSSAPEEAKEHRKELIKRIEFAGKLGIEKIITSTGINKIIEEGVYDTADAIRRIPIHSLDEVVAFYTPIIEIAEKNNVKIAFENCPLMGNIAISPVLWRELFKRLDSPFVGLAYDPSHLIWQFIDPYNYIDEFSEKIIHVHAKDTVIDQQKLTELGFLTNFDWWGYRLPGRGQLDWKKFMDALARNNYKGTISIEHEDDIFSDTLEKVQEGLILGKKHILKQ